MIILDISCILLRISSDCLMYRQKKSRENLEQWKDTLEGLRDITNNPLPFLLTLLKKLKDDSCLN